MYEYYQELKNNDKFVFNIDKIDSMNDETFKICQIKTDCLCKPMRLLQR